MFRHFGVDDPDEEDFHERYDEILGPAFAVQIVKDAWVRKCLEMFGKRVVDRAETIDGVSAGEEVGKWTRDLLTVANVSPCCLSTSVQLD